MYKYVLSSKLFSKFFFFLELGTHVCTEEVLKRDVTFLDFFTKMDLAHDVTEILYIGHEKYNGTKYLCKQEHITIQQIFLEPFPLKPQRMKAKFYPSIAAVW